MKSALLELEKVTLTFRGLTAVNTVSLQVREQEILSIIGPNGAGKTSLFNVVSGIYSPSSGVLRFQGSPLADQLAFRKVLSWVFSGSIAGLILVLFCFIELLWNTTITAHFTYGGSFPWREAVQSFISTFASLLGGDGALLFCVGVLGGIWGAFLNWKRFRGSAEYVARRGISRTFQNIRLFPQLSVEENLRVAWEGRHSLKFFRALFGGHSGTMPADERSRIDSLLALVGLEGKGAALAGSLPYGQQRRLEIARALSTDPKLLLLDEPAAGMNPSESAELMDLIRKIREKGITILLIEHHMELVMGISDRIAVLHYGNKIAEGTPAEVRANPKVIEAYLGKEG